MQTYSKPNDEVIKSIRSTILINYFDLIILEYSIGQEVARIKNTFIKLLVFMIDYWEEKSLDEFKFGDIDEPFYSTDEYWQLLTIISFSIILDLNDEYFERLILIRDKVKGSDILLDL
ncbi:MAG: DUF1910 domain-containing protein [Chitinophagales bacterium]